MILAACAIVAIASPSSAQTPAAAPAAPAAPPAAGGTPDTMPFDIPYGLSIGIERAKQVMAAAEAEAKKRNWKMNIAVVDTHGELVHFVRMDGAQIANYSGPVGYYTPGINDYAKFGYRVEIVHSAVFVEELLRRDGARLQSGPEGDGASAGDGARREGSARPDRTRLAGTRITPDALVQWLRAAR